MALNEQGFALVDLPEVSHEFLDSYDDCPVDEYMGNGTRFKRFCQYKLMYNENEGWQFELLPHRDYTAYKKFNPIAGGIKRKYEPIEADFTPLIQVGIEGFELDTEDSWQINVHQNRSIADGDRSGPLTPEGVHHDGHEFVMIGVLRRHNVGGGLTRLWNPGEDKPFWTGTLEPGQAVLLDDQRIAHDVTDVTSADGGRGNRDIFIVAFSRWEEKWYGDEHDDAVLSEAAATM
jgi:hypothetical protein